MTSKDAAVHAQIMQKNLSQHRARYLKYFQASDYEAALAEVRQARQLSGDIEIVHAEVLCLTRLNQIEEALAALTRVPPSQRTVDLYDRMADLHNKLGNTKEGQRYGALSLKLKDQQNAIKPAWPLPSVTPPAFTPDPSVNIVAYSLYGSNPRYCEGAVLNCHAVARLLPGWSCRFYHDQSVPDDVLLRLRRAGAQLLLVNDGVKKQIPPLMWRNLVVDSPEVHRFLLRDADAVVSEREKICVDAWLRSPFWFHLIRDWGTHSELMLAGLWGGCSGVIPDMRQEIIRYMSPGNRSPSHHDQHFLRECLWPTVRQSVLSHDSQFDFFNNTPMEPLPPVNDVNSDEGERHIGSNLSNTKVAISAPYPDGALVRWTLYDHADNPVCSYEMPVQQRACHTALPVSYWQKINRGLWKIRTAKAEPTV